MTDEQADLFRRVVVALGAAASEITLMEEYDIPVPDDIEDALRERDALIATLSYAKERLGSKDEIDALHEKYRVERRKRKGDLPSGRYLSPRIAADETVREHIEAIIEDLRRAAHLESIPWDIAPM